MDKETEIPERVVERAQFDPPLAPEDSSLVEPVELVESLLKAVEIVLPITAEFAWVKNQRQRSFLYCSAGWYQARKECYPACAN